MGCAFLKILPRSFLFHFIGISHCVIIISTSIEFISVARNETVICKAGKHRLATYSYLVLISPTYGLGKMFFLSICLLVLSCFY